MPSSDPVPGWKPHGPACFCSRCYAARRRVEISAREYVYAIETSEHIAALVAAGWSQAAISRASGLSVGCISKATHPDRVIDSETAEKILAVG